MDSIDVESLKELPMEKLSEIARAAAKALQDKKFAAKHFAHSFFNNLNQPITNLH